MAVSATGASGLSIRSMRALTGVVAGIAGVGFYLYGPAVTPALHAAAVAECNDITGGSYRHVRLDWVAGVTPYWQCSWSNDPGRAAVDMGWWVTPTL
jgi:hypothetical protein